MKQSKVIILKQTREDAPDLSDTPGGNTRIYQFPYLTDDIIEDAMRIVRDRFPIGKDNQISSRNYLMIKSTTKDH